MEIDFSKYHGTGNDFIIIDNQDNSLALPAEVIKHLCHRQFGIGADGLMMLNKEDGYDFRMVYYNADGNESSMCGNGGRCLVKFAFDSGISKSHFNFIAIDGPHVAFLEDSIVKLKMINVPGIETTGNDYILNTGSPHFVRVTQGVGSLNVLEEGRIIRYSDRFRQEGINVNFVEKAGNKLYVRTYERGVEDETLSCGTGVTACALALTATEGHHEIPVTTPGGDLHVLLNKTSRGFEDIWLCGPAVFIFKGTIEV